MFAPTWAIPVFLTVLCLLGIFRPYHSQGDYDFIGPAFRIFWLIPIGLIWTAYCAFGWWAATH